jgi:hypothetical protein
VLIFAISSQRSHAEHFKYPFFDNVLLKETK